MITTRFAPSPTGNIHIGSLRTAIYAFALARKNKGKFILRIEDTDKKREVKGSKEKIEELLKRFGIEWDEQFVQSERVESGIYKKAALKLVQNGYAYEDEGAIRLKIPKDETISYHDYVLDKEISWDTNTLEDLVLLKSDGFPTYHLAVVVDDHDMNVTHILRGHDWMPSTPIHLLVYKYLGYDLPEIGHLTDILDPEGGKLSKRKGSTSVEGMLKEGYLPEALANFVILLGWAPKDNREFFTIDEFIKHFDPRGFQKSNPVLNREKLDWLNGHYIREKSDQDLIKLILPFAPQGADEKIIASIVPLVKDRIKKLSDFTGLTGFFFARPKVDTSMFGKNYEKHLQVARETIEAISPWNIETLDEKLMEAVKKHEFKTGNFFMDLRIAITGSRFTPPINESLLLLGKDETLARLSHTA